MDPQLNLEEGIWWYQNSRLMAGNFRQFYCDLFFILFYFIPTAIGIGSEWACTLHSFLDETLGRLALSLWGCNLYISVRRCQKNLSVRTGRAHLVLKPLLIAGVKVTRRPHMSSWFPQLHPSVMSPCFSSPNYKVAPSHHLGPLTHSHETPWSSVLPSSWPLHSSVVRELNVLTSLPSRRFDLQAHFFGPSNWIRAIAS
jgi:hypothetical protein